MPVRVTVTADASRTLEEAINTLGSQRVLVGIAEKDDNAHGTRGGSIGNASIGYTMERGSPAKNIPARPHLVPGIQNSVDQWAPYLQAAAEAAFNGDARGVEQNLHRVGIVARDAVKAVIQSKIPPPLKPATVAARARRRRSWGKEKRAAFRGEHRAFVERFEAGLDTMMQSPVTPLIDTGDYIRSITYAIEKK